MTTKQATKKEISILNIYRWKSPISRICFEIESSDGSQKYNVCFDQDENHGSCGCDGNSVWHKDCKHLKALRPKAAEYFAARQPGSVEVETPGLDAAEQRIASLRKQVAAQEARHWYETSGFGGQAPKMERVPGTTRLVPMR